MRVCMWAYVCTCAYVCMLYVCTLDIYNTCFICLALHVNTHKYPCIYLYSDEIPSLRNGQTANLDRKINLIFKETEERS